MHECRVGKLMKRFSSQTAWLQTPGWKGEVSWISQTFHHSYPGPCWMLPLWSWRGDANSISSLLEDISARAPFTTPLISLGVPGVYSWLVTLRYVGVNAQKIVVYVVYPFWYSVVQCSPESVSCCLHCQECLSGLHYIVRVYLWVLHWAMLGTSREVDCKCFVLPITGCCSYSRGTWSQLHLMC